MTLNKWLLRYSKEQDSKIELIRHYIFMEKRFNCHDMMVTLDEIRYTFDTKMLIKLILTIKSNSQYNAN